MTDGDERDGGAPPGGVLPGDEPSAAAVPAAAPPPEVAALTDGEWHRLHPATPLLKGGTALVVALGVIVYNARDWVVQLVAGMVSGRRGGDDGDPFGYVVDHGLLGWVLLGLVVVVGVLSAFFWLAWRMNTFRVTDDTVEVRSGIVFRTNRRARLDRVQGIAVQRPVLARLVGAAKLEVSQAGDDANVSLAYLRSSSADDLRREILRRASGAQRSEGVSLAKPGEARHGFVGLVEQRAAEFLAEGADPEEALPGSVVRVPLGRLVGSVLLSGSTVFIVAAVVAVVVSVRLTGEWFLLFALLPAVIGSSGYYVGRISKSLRYSIAGTRDGVRIGYGLFSTTNETLPPGRIHSVSVSQPLLWRPKGWWQISINRASRSSASASQSGQQGNSVLLPVGDEADVRRVLALVLPELVGLAAAEAEELPGASGPGLPEGAAAVDVVDELHDAADGHASHTLRLVEDGLTSRGSEGGFTTSPRRAAVLRWFSWRRNGFRSAPGALLLRTGAIWRQLVIVPLPRVQSVGLHQGPLLRRLRLASVHLHTVSGPITARIGALDERDALEFFTRASHDAVEAARADCTHRWLATAAASAPASASPPVASAPAASASASAPAASAPPAHPTPDHPTPDREDDPR